MLQKLTSTVNSFENENYPIEMAKKKAATKKKRRQEKQKDPHLGRNGQGA